MDKILEAINNAYQTIGLMKVSGDNQDLCVAAKTELRKAYKMLEGKNDPTENTDNK